VTMPTPSWTNNKFSSTFQTSADIHASLAPVPNDSSRFSEGGTARGVGLASNRREDNWRATGTAAATDGVSLGQPSCAPARSDRIRVAISGLTRSSGRD
jgi:hypothetical protein